MEKVYFKTFGCRTNQFDTQIMLSSLKSFEHTADESKSDIVVINSCTVTNGADSSVRHYIASLKKRNPNAKIVLAGCGAHSKGDLLFENRDVFGVMGHSEKTKLDSFLKLSDPFYQIGDLEHIDSNIVEDFVGKSRAFIKIQEGCDFECSYCIIPQVRGKARSHKSEIILKQIEILAANGYGEFILTGTNVGSFGKDSSTSIAKLIKKIAQIRGVRRIRVGSLEPVQIDDEFKEILQEPWMAKHLHIALQHTNDDMLKLMNRRNCYTEDKKLLEEIAAHGYAIGTDFIVGHPGESKERWEDALQKVHSLPLTHIHSFTYSRRDDTRSATMTDIVKGDIAKQRLSELNLCIKKKNEDFRKKYHKNLDILVESSNKNGIFKGYDQYYNLVEIESSIDISHNWINANRVELKDDKNFFKYEH